MVALTACGSDPVGPREPEDVTFHPSLNVDLSQMTKTESGLYYRVLEAGTGTEVTAPGDFVTFAYVFRLSNGTVIEADGLHAATLGGAAGEQALIIGVDEGLRGMRLGETRQLVIPYYLGYGAEAVPQARIPAFATLVFHVTVVEFES
jgi:FKBP-type peptidyl-prolyl cis-trans isomerase